MKECGRRGKKRDGKNEDRRAKYSRLRGKGKEKGKRGSKRGESGMDGVDKEEGGNYGLERRNAGMVDGGKEAVEKVKETRVRME